MNRQEVGFETVYRPGERAESLAVVGHARHQTPRARHTSCRDRYQSGGADFPVNDFFLRNIAAKPANPILINPSVPGSGTGLMLIVELPLPMVPDTVINPSGLTTA